MGFTLAFRKRVLAKAETILGDFGEFLPLDCDDADVWIMATYLCDSDEDVAAVSRAFAD